MQAGPIVPGIKAQWSQRILEAELELANEHAARLAAYEAHVKRMQDVEQMSKKHYEAGRLPLVGYSEAKFFRAEAELWLAKEKAKP